MTLYYNVIKAFLDPTVYGKYRSVIDEKYLKENYPETSRVFQSLHALHRAGEGSSVTYSVDDLALRFFTDYPNASTNDYGRIFDAIRSAEAQPTSVHQYLHALLERQRASALAELAIAVSDGSRPFAELRDALAQSDPPAGDLADGPNDSDLFADDDITRIFARETATPGLRWRLESLNKSLGSLRKGHFGFIFARPESGKTTFLASEITHMATQTTGDIFWFNNEQANDDVIKYVYRAALGIDEASLKARTAYFLEKYRALVGDRIKVIEISEMDAPAIEALLSRHNPALAIFDQIDAVEGFGAERNDLELEAKYVWARKIAKKYCPVIAVCQAGGSGENKRWLTMNDVNNSKTGKQGAADWILGIGHVLDDGLEQVRYFNLSKNKLPGDSDTDPARRHDQWEVKINPVIARYEDWA